MNILCSLGIHKEGKLLDKEYLGKTVSQGTGNWYDKYKLTLQCDICGKEYIKKVIK